jgi:hypothetical protein
MLRAVVDDMQEWKRLKKSFSGYQLTPNPTTAFRKPSRPRESAPALTADELSAQAR